MKYETINDACHAWVNEFNAFPLGMIEKLYKAEPDDWSEVTPLVAGCRAYSYEYQESGEVLEVDEDVAQVALDDGDIIETDRDDLTREDDSFFPMWGTMWQFGDVCDSEWGRNHLEEMASCGLRIYESNDFGCFFGIDGAGYSFYEEHWIPLYKARGLHWHKEED